MILKLWECVIFPKLLNLISENEELPKSMNLELKDEKQLIASKNNQDKSGNNLWIHIKNKLRNIVL